MVRVCQCALGDVCAVDFEVEGACLLFTLS